MVDRLQPYFLILPGTAASAATMQDGYPMTRRRAGKALKTATVASVFGDYWGEFILILVVLIASVTRTFGPTEYFAIYVMAFVVIGSVVGDSVMKGIMSTLFGGFVALIGMDTITGETRMTMGIFELDEGLLIGSIVDWSFCDIRDYGANLHFIFVSVRAGIEVDPPRS